MITNFLTILNGVITGHHGGDPEVDYYGTEFYGHERIIIPSGVRVNNFDKVEFYDENWERKSDIQLIDEGLLPMPEGYVREGDELRRMSPEERIIAGLDDPPSGFKVEGGEIVEMTPEEKIAAGVITQEDYNAQVEAENTAELNRRLAESQTPEALARAEIDEEFALERKAKLAALLAVKEQEDWPLNVVWPVFE